MKSILFRIFIINGVLITAFILTTIFCDIVAKATGYYAEGIQESQELYQ